ncbi:MAG TPA: Xaa-Pro peptidase family protein [Acidimicrobiales bacterium]|nr:Xaa-Pro peptidase family protein [Acidimicrobiales bacterium]
MAPLDRKTVTAHSWPPMDIAGRLCRAREAAAAAGCDAVVISHLANVRYLTGFRGSAAKFVLGTDSDLGVLVTDGRYATQAPAELARAGAEARVEALAADEQLELLGGLTSGLPRVGFEAEHVAWGERRRWGRGWARGHRLVPTTGLVEGLRSCKDAGEVARVAAAARLADQAYRAVLALLAERPEEAEVALALDSEMRRRGADGPAFATIVASGPNAAEPHHTPGSRRVRRGELVVLDFGARVEGYCSDMTRTVRAGGEEGELAGELRAAAGAVLASQDAGLAAVRDGAGGAEVDRACREVIEAAGLGEYFVHGTGHGVGLDIHEAPSLAKRSRDILSRGQVVTVEPGVYVPGLGGVRTEDTVVVTDAGCEVLTLTPKQAHMLLGGQPPGARCAPPAPGRKGAKPKRRPKAKSLTANST